MQISLTQMSTWLSNEPFDVCLYHVKRPT